MITRIECANCSDVIEVSSKSLSLPFHCNACDENIGKGMLRIIADEPLDENDCKDISMEEVLGNPRVHEKLAEKGLKVDEAEVERFYEDMALMAGCKSDKLAQPGLPTPHEPCACDDCRNPKGTLEERDATNALLSDLEAQNTNLINEVTVLDNKIVELKKEVETTQMWENKSYATVGRYMKYIEGLQDELAELQGKNFSLVKRALKAEGHPWKNLWAYLWE